jgi:type II secretory ATPase GspE/PulE/Tfp pilus assembly ATPase PilB-like protein
VKGVSQIQVNPKVGLTFASGLRAILRQDPDVIMVGEIRDAETAEIAVHAALTGHLVLSTLHTNDAVSAVARLADLGIEPFLIASSLEGVIAQRLVRKYATNVRPHTSHPRRSWKSLAWREITSFTRAWAVSTAWAPATREGRVSLRCLSWTKG